MKKGGKYFIIFFAFLLIEAPSYAQNNKVKDSLLAIAFKNNPDTNSVVALQTIQRNFFNAGLYDSAFNYSHALIAVAKKINHKQSLVKAYFNIGSVYINLYKSDSALHYNRLAEKEAIEQKDSFLLAHCYTNFSIQYRYLSDHTTAFEYALKGAEIGENSSDSSIIKTLPKLYANIGNNLVAQKHFLKAIEYEKKALQITNYPDEQRYRILILLDIADAYLKLGKVEDAGKYIVMAVAENEVFDNKVLDIQTLNTEGTYYEKLGFPDVALKKFISSYNLCDSIKNEFLKSEVANNIAINFLNQKQYSNALHYATKANEISLRLKQHKIAATSFEVLKEITAAQGNYKLAFELSEQFRKYEDSATNEAIRKQTLSLEKKHETEKKEKEIADLTVANTSKELAVEKRNRWLLGGGLSGLLLLVILGSRYRIIKQKQIIATKESALQLEQIKFLTRQQQVVSLQSMVNGQETERSRIAKDLHDGLGGLFSTIKMYFSTLQHEQESLNQNELFNKSYKLIDTASEEVRRIAHNMMPEGLMKLGLIPALEDMCSNISAAKQVQVKLQSFGMAKRFNASTEIMLYRIVQELLNNIIKHAQATEVIVQFNREGNQLTVTVEDNGRGFSIEESDDKKHKGLETIKSRVNYLNGQISIDSEIDVGTTVLMDFFINEDIENS